MLTIRSVIKSFSLLTMDYALTQLAKPSSLTTGWCDVQNTRFYPYKEIAICRRKDDLGTS